MSMPKSVVPVHVRMCLRQQRWVIVMLIVLVVRVAMLMFHLFVDMLVPMTFGQVQPNADDH
jgi:hypothetical protein